MNRLSQKPVEKSETSTRMAGITLYIHKTVLVIQEDCQAGSAASPVGSQRIYGRLLWKGISLAESDQHWFPFCVYISLRMDSEKGMIFDSNRNNRAQSVLKSVSLLPVLSHCPGDLTV